MKIREYICDSKNEAEYLVSTSEVKYIALALYSMKKFYKSFWNRFPQDGYQIAVLAALEVEGVTPDEKAAKYMHEIIKQELKNFGLVFDYRTYRWRSLEVPLSDWILSRSVWDDGDICGVPGCVKLGAYNDAKYVMLCRNHYNYVLNRRKAGAKDIHEDIEKSNKRGGKKVEKEYSDIDYVRKKLDLQQIKQVRNLLALGVTPARVSERTKIPENIVSFILYSTTWN